MKTVLLPDATAMPAIGLGTWRMGEQHRARAAEVSAVLAALAIGYRLIDTAEMYGEGGAEEVVGEALAQGGVPREELFIVSKVYPHHASREGVAEACERSLARLGLGHLDLYLLHWPGSHPLRETVAGFELLRERGLIRRWGVSNFDTAQMAALWKAPHGDRCAANQIYLSLTQRGAEFELLPQMRRLGVPAMAYSPIDQGVLLKNTKLTALAHSLGTTASRLALAWLLRDGQVAVIPKAISREHLLDNFAAGDTVLDEATCAKLDQMFPPPRGPQALAMI